MSFFGLNNSKTFKPKRSIPEGSKQAELKKFAEATLGSGNLKLAVELPQGEDLNEWLAVNTVDFFNQINLLYGTITEFCTPQDCPIMSAGPKFEYHWCDGVQFKKPVKIICSRICGLFNDMGIGAVGRSDQDYDGPIKLVRQDVLLGVYEDGFKRASTALFQTVWKSPVVPTFALNHLRASITRVRCMSSEDTSTNMSPLFKAAIEEAKTRTAQSKSPSTSTASSTSADTADSASVDIHAIFQSHARSCQSSSVLYYRKHASIPSKMNHLARLIRKMPITEAKDKWHSLLNVAIKLGPRMPEGTAKDKELRIIANILRRKKLYISLEDSKPIQRLHPPWSRKPWKYVTSPRWTNPDRILIKKQ
ncbi:MOB kinase activator 1B [Batrachochytrium salamandrivorans]|nr:MOB kinase activator 1B [Batrachochytrium salamandrivorans]